MSAARANIGPSGARLRALTGGLTLVAGVAVSFWLIGAGVDRPWRIALVPLFYLAGLGIFQARAKV